MKLKSRTHAGEQHAENPRVKCKSKLCFYNILYVLQWEKAVFKRIWEAMNEHKLKTLFVSGVVIDFWANWYSYAIVHDWIVLQAMLGFFLPILNFPFIHWFIDESDISERFKMTLVTAFSMVLGSTLMLVMIRLGIGVGEDFIP